MGQTWAGHQRLAQYNDCQSWFGQSREKRRSQGRLLPPCLNIQRERSADIQLIAEGSSKFASIPSGGAGGAVASSGAAAGGAAAADAPAAEEKKVEEKEESDDDMGFGLFD
jgi:hypothetical protein